MLTNLFYAVMASVVLAALLRGGRPHRRVALTILAAYLANGAAQALITTRLPADVYLAVDLIAFAVLVRTWRFRPQTWSAVVATAHAGMVATDLLWLSPVHPRRSIVYDHIVYAFAYLQLGALLLGVLVRWLGPPLRRAT